MSLSLPTEFMRANWRTFAEFVAAAILLAIIQRSQATFGRRISNPDGQPTTATHLAYAASAVIQPGQTSMLEYGSHVRSRRPGAEAVPTVMRKFEPIHTKELDEEQSSQSTGSRYPSPAPTSSSVSASDDPDNRLLDITPPPSPPSKVLPDAGIRTTYTKKQWSQNSHPNATAAQKNRSTSVPLTTSGVSPSLDSANPLPIEDLSQYLKDHPTGFTGAVKVASRAASTPPRRELPPAMPATPAASLATTNVNGSSTSKGKKPSSASSKKKSTSTALTVRNTRASSVAAIDPESIAKTFTRRSSKCAAWFESNSNDKIDGPPDLTSRDDLKLGDVYIHRTVDDYQLWVWEMGKDKEPFWKEVPVMYTRSDGKRLTVTQAWRLPSWVGEQWARKQQKKT